MIEEQVEKLEVRINEQDEIIRLLIQRMETLERKLDDSKLSQEERLALSMLVPIGGCRG